MKSLAVIVTHGAYNNLLQAYQFAKIAADAGTQVNMFFRDEAVAKLTKEKVLDMQLSAAYMGRESKVRDMYREQKLHDLPALFRSLKDAGDVKLSVCRESIAYFEIEVECLIGELDEVQRAEAFWKEAVESADQVLTF